MEEVLDKQASTWLSLDQLYLLWFRQVALSSNSMACHKQCCSGLLGMGKTHLNHPKPGLLITSTSLGTFLLSLNIINANWARFPCQSLNALNLPTERYAVAGPSFSVLSTLDPVSVLSIFNPWSEKYHPPIFAEIHLRNPACLQPSGLKHNFGDLSKTKASKHGKPHIFNGRCHMMLKSQALHKWRLSGTLPWCWDTHALP